MRNCVNELIHPRPNNLRKQNCIPISTYLTLMHTFATHSVSYENQCLYLSLVFEGEGKMKYIDQSTVITVNQITGCVCSSVKLLLFAIESVLSNTSGLGASAVLVQWLFHVQYSLRFVALRTCTSSRCKHGIVACRL